MEQCGFLQFSILRPCFVPPHRRMLREADGTTVRAIEVAGYFDVIDGRVDRWWFGAASQEERACGRRYAGGAFIPARAWP